MDLNLRGKTAIVTGGGSGLGASISEILAQEGANVVVNYLTDAAQKENFAESLNQQYGVNCTAIHGDISKVADIESVIFQTITRYGRIDILVNNAGIWPKHPILEMPDEAW